VHAIGSWHPPGQQQPPAGGREDRVQLGRERGSLSVRQIFFPEYDQTRAPVDGGGDDVHQRPVGLPPVGEDDQSVYHVGIPSSGLDAVA
jgi:hypothetical protein